MKFQVYADKEIFENILLDDSKYENWNNIMKFHSDIHLNISQEAYDLDIEDIENSIIFQYLQQTAGKEPVPNEKFFQDFEADNSMVLNEPFSTYFLNKNDREISDLTGEFGMIFQNNNIDDNILSNPFFINLKKGQVYGDTFSLGWSSLTLPRKYVFNSLVITEEHLFHNEETIRGVKINLGVINIIGFLDFILPQKLGIDFHLTIVSEMKNGNIPENFCQNFYDEINTALGEIRKYKIIFELIFTNETLHNRSAYSNYCVTTLDKGYKVFSAKEKNKIYAKNKLTVNNIFITCEPNSGDTHFQEIIDDLPDVKKGIRNSTEYVKNRGNSMPNFRCFGFDDTYTIKNRLLNYFP